jgi:hypothetical protein
MAPFPLQKNQNGKGKDAMRFTELYQEKIYGVISGLDRIRFRGTDRMLSNKTGFRQALNSMGVLFKDFGKWAEARTLTLRAQCAKQAKALGIPTRYLSSSGVDKEALARKIAREDGVAEDGSICMLSVMECCKAPTVVGDRETKRLTVEMRPRKCVYLYHYFDHPEVGFGHVRLQTWAPYTVDICLNGRHWLEKQLLAQGIEYVKVDNCFPWIAEVGAAQHLMDAQLQTSWPDLLNTLMLNLCPGLPTLCAPFEIQHYWSADQSEFATDVMFHSAADLDTLFPLLVQHGMRVSDCKAVLRYFGRRQEQSSLGNVPRQVQSDCCRRHEGVRIKHWVNGDSIKLYNKAGGIVLRGETTINHARNFKAFRPPNDDESKRCSWQKMRKGVNDLHRRCEVSLKANERYLDALSVAQVNQTLRDVCKDACNRTSKNERPVRGLNPWNKQDAHLLTFLAKGEWALNGFRNKNLCRYLEPRFNERLPQERKKLSAKATRLIGLLRAHALIRKVPKENRYLLTELGQTFASALLIAGSIAVKQLTEMAA